MHYFDVLAKLRHNKNQNHLEVVGPPKLDFISPAMSAVLAAARLVDPAIGRMGFANADCESYASNTGLLDALQGNTPVANSGSLSGKSYSPLTKLSSAAEVRYCNAVITNVLYANLANDGNKPFVEKVAKIVGELHDNAAAHASGSAFSATQVYGQRLEFAIADCGCGMLRNVRKVRPDIRNYPDAILWCLERGNTTARARDDMAQRVPDDCIVSPMPDGVETYTDENHHYGEGLWRLTELLKATSGKAWIWSGNGTVYIDGNAPQKVVKLDDLSWSGVVVELEFDMGRIQSLGDDSEVDLSDLAARLGI